MSNRNIRFVSWMAVIVWMAAIFHLSSQVAEESNRLSTMVTKNVAITMEQVKPSEEINLVQLNRIVRKHAHFLAYLILGILTVQALRRSNISLFQSFLYSLLICIAYAISDEWHQYFVPGRGPQVKDVWIDSAGAFVGASVYCAASIIRRILVR